MSRITKLGDGLWSVDAETRLAPSVFFPLRMAVMQVAGELLLHSPVPIEPALARELADLGPVGHLLAPNKFHHRYLAQAAERYPGARVWGVPGMTEKFPEIRFDAVLGQDSAPGWAAHLDQVGVSGVPAINEVVTLHRPSRSLLVTDLVFNMTRIRGLLSPLALWLVGGQRGFAHSRAWRWFFVRDRPAAGLDLARVLSWDFDRIVPCHGEVLEVDARARLADRLSYLTAAHAGSEGSGPADQPERGR
ncbi:MAG: DUF4336 domain-containing protein [Myxococcales bacterium]|nr:DUF4336 domain-containing protein [Myxococcales bacterium]